MKITFLGATHEVTGSLTLINVGGKNIVIDCGMEQGADIFENQSLPVPANDIDCVLLTHAHIDHSGNLPLLVKNGFKGDIYATRATCNLCNIMLRDSAHIQMTEAEWKNRKSRRAGRAEQPAVYDMDDAELAIKLLKPCDYGEVREIYDCLSVRFNDIGHLLGSAALEVWLTEGGETRKMAFSGDIGNINQPILNDPAPVSEADYVLIESTYGDRYHPPRPDYIANITAFIQKTLDRGGNVVIPSFAVGRTQELLYFMRHIKENGLIKGHDGFPVFVDSPLAIAATNAFMNADNNNFDEELNALLRKGVNPLSFPGLTISETADESKAINFDQRPKVIVSASGMCEAGRIRHHLKHNLWRPECLILFVGYQANGTLGRLLLDGTDKVKLFGEEISVKAEIGFLDGVSGHADKQGLINWLDGFAKKPKAVFVNHGEDSVCESFTECLRTEHGLNAIAPYSGTEFDLIKGVITFDAKGVPVEPKRPRVSAVHEKLLNAVARLQSAAQAGSGMANAELEKRTQDIERMLDEWAR